MESNLSFTATFETTKPLKTLKFSGVLCFLGGEKGPYGNVRGNTVCWVARVQILVDGAALLSFPLLAIAIFLPDSLMLVSGWMITALGWIFYECLSRCKRVAAG